MNTFKKLIRALKGKSVHFSEKVEIAGVLVPRSEVIKALEYASENNLSALWVRKELITKYADPEEVYVPMPSIAKTKYTSTSKYTKYKRTRKKKYSPLKEM